MIRAAALALALVVGACARDGGGPRPIEHRGAAAAPVDAGVVDAADPPCVAACVRDRQMVATSPAAIADACRRDCAAAP